MSFMRFLDLTIADDIPDNKTIWNFRDRLIDLELVEVGFNIFLEELKSLNLIINEGKIVDASFIEIPKQRNSKSENDQIKNGETPESFTQNPNKQAQKDTDARWTTENNVTFFGYKNHLKTDSKSKRIEKYVVTEASVHDSQALDPLLDEEDAGQELHADSAYTGVTTHTKKLAAHFSTFVFPNALSKHKKQKS